MDDSIQYNLSERYSLSVHNKNSPQWKVLDIGQNTEAKPKPHIFYSVMMWHSYVTFQMLRLQQTLLCAQEPTFCKADVEEEWKAFWEGVLISVKEVVEGCSEKKSVVKTLKAY